MPLSHDPRRWPDLKVLESWWGGRLSNPGSAAAGRVGSPPSALGLGCDVGGSGARHRMWGGVCGKGAFQAEESAGARYGVGEWRRRAAGGAVEPETPARSRGGPGPAWRWSLGLPFCFGGRLS